MARHRCSRISHDGHRFLLRMVIWAALMGGGATHAESPIRPGDRIAIVGNTYADQLRILVRAPLEAMRDITFPLVGQGFLDVPQSGSTLRDAAELWLASNIEAYENDEPLALRIVGLQQDHVAPVATPAVEVSLGGRAGLLRNDHLEDAVTDRIETVAQAEVGQTGIPVADLEAELVTDRVLDRTELTRDEGDLSKSHHGQS